MGYNLSTVFSFQDQMSSKLAGIVKEGKSATAAFNDVGSAIEKAFKTASVSQFETKTVSSFDKLGNTVMDSSKTMERALDDSIDEMKSSVKKLDDNFDKLGNDTIPDASKEIGKLGDKSDDTGKSVERLDNRSSSLGSTIRTLAGIVGTVFAVNQVKDFAEDTLNSYIEFESSMKEVYTLLPGITKDGMDQMEQQINSFDQSMGTLSSESIPALYEALSSGVPQDTIFDFLEVANKAAVGGVTELGTTVNGLTSVINAYGADTIDVGTASDLMFQTVKLGKATFDELSNSLYNVNPTAAAAGVSFSDVSAALAAMTAQGVPTSVATTQLRQALVELTKTGTDTDKTFRKISGESFKDFIAGGGDMQDAFQMMEAYAEKSNLGINDLFSSVEAGNAVLSLTGKGTDLFTQAMQAMEDAAGSTDAAYDVMTESVSHKMDVLASTWESVKLSAGESLGEAIAPLADDLSENLDEINQPISDIFSMLGNNVSKAGTLIPKILRGISDGFETLGNKAGPIFSWIQENPKLIETSLVGIGSAIVSYKIISALPELATGFKAVGAALTGNPWGLVATALVTAIVTIGTAIKKQEKELKKENLAEHFGSISLSLDDLEDAAAHILKSNVLDKLSTSLESLDTINELAESIDDSVAEINKMNWKVSIGMKLTEEEKEGYIASVESFIKDSRDLLSEQQYAMNINMQVFTNEGGEGDTVEAAMNAFYQRNQTKVAELGTELQDAVNKAFEDGLLDVDEASVIADYMQQISDITQAISQAQFEASLERLSIDYSGTKLSSDSFSQLQEELSKQTEAAIAGIQESYENTIAQYKVAVDMGDLSKELYQSAMQQAKENYLSQEGEIELKAANFQMDTLLSSYDDELSKAMPEFKEKLQSYMKTYFTDDDYVNMWNDAPGTMFHNLFAKDSELFNSDELDKTTRNALKDLFEKLQPTLNQMEQLKVQYKQYGVDIPSALSEGITDAEVLGALVRDTNSVTGLIGDTIANNDEYTKIIDNCKAMGANIPDTISKAIEEAPPVSATVPISLKLNPIFDSNWLEEKLTGKMTSSELPDGWAALADPTKALAGHADGGIFDTPHVAWFAEDGPEAAIPLDGSDNAKDLWERTGHMLGLYNSLEAPTLTQNSVITETNNMNNNEKKSIELNINGKGSIKVDGRLSREAMIEVMMENVRPVLINLIQEEIFEEGEGTYEY